MHPPGNALHSKTKFVSIIVLGNDSSSLCLLNIQLLFYCRNPAQVNTNLCEHLADPKLNSDDLEELSQNSKVSLNLLRNIKQHLSVKF